MAPLGVCKVEKSHIMQFFHYLKDKSDKLLAKCMLQNVAHPDFGKNSVKFFDK